MSTVDVEGKIAEKALTRARETMTEIGLAWSKGLHPPVAVSAEDMLGICQTLLSERAAHARTRARLTAVEDAAHTFVEADRGCRLNIFQPALNEREWARAHALMALHALFPQNATVSPPPTAPAADTTPPQP